MREMEKKGDRRRGNGWKGRARKVGEVSEIEGYLKGEIGWGREKGGWGVGDEEFGSGTRGGCYM